MKLVKLVARMLLSTSLFLTTHHLAAARICTGIPPNCTMYGDCCGSLRGIHPGVCVDPACDPNTPFPVIQPSPDPGLDPEPDRSPTVSPIYPTVPSGTPIPDVAVSVPASAVPNAFTSVVYNGTIPAAKVFRSGSWVAYSDDGAYGNMTHGTGPISLHVSVPTKWTPSSNTLVVCDKKAHVTSWYTPAIGAQQICYVYADGNCGCGNASNWNLCTSSNTIKPVMVAAARAAAVALSATYNALPRVTVKGYNATDCR